jgi:myosin heavy subunit
MFTAAINLSITDVIVLQVMAIVLGVVVHFVIVSRRNLQDMVEQSNQENSLTGSGSNHKAFNEPELKTPAPAALPEPAVPEKEVALRRTKLTAHKTPAPVPVKGNSDVLLSLKESIEQQQKALDKLMLQVDNWTEDMETSASSRVEIEELEILLEKKDLELMKVKQQLSASQKMAARIDEVYKEFDELQVKITDLEQNSKYSNEVAMELEELKGSYTQVKKELTRKQEKLEEVVSENQRLHEQLSVTEDKLDEANMQRQQLMKKLQMLENMNTDFHQMSESNKKLQNELRRIAELESMLSMVSDERDLLLKKRTQ